MEFKDIKDIPNVDVIIDKLNDSSKDIPVDFVGLVLLEAIKNLLVRNYKKFELSEKDASNLGLSLLTSIGMTILAYDMSKKELAQLAKECGVPIASFTSFDSGDKSYDA